jgi:hypothetical protein
MPLLMVVKLLPELELIASLLGRGKTHLMKQLLVIGAITALNDAVAPRRGFRDEGMNPP